MKYAKKFKLVPYSTETPGVSQVATTFNNALTSNTFPDEKVKIYNQALSKIKELNPTDTSIDKKYDKFEENNDDPNEDPDDRKKRIAKEIEELEKITSEQTASKTVKDYSNSDFLKTQKYKEKSKFDNEKFMNLLTTLSNDLYSSYGKMYHIEKHLNMLSGLQQGENATKMEELRNLRNIVSNLNPNLTWNDNSLTYKNNTLNPRYSAATPEYVDKSINNTINTPKKLKNTPIDTPKNTVKLKETPIQIENQADYIPILNKSDSLKKVSPEQNTPKRSKLTDITPLEPMTYITPQANQLVNSVSTANKPITTQFYGFTNDLSYINEDENNDKLNLTNLNDLDLTEPLPKLTKKQKHKQEKNQKAKQKKIDKANKSLEKYLRKQKEKLDNEKIEEENVEKSEEAPPKRQRVLNDHPISNIIPQEPEQTRPKRKKKKNDI